MVFNGLCPKSIRSFHLAIRACSPLFGLLAIFISGCVHKAHGPALTGTKSVRGYQVRGVVKEVALDRRGATIRHEAIPGYMPKMTMEFTVLDPRELEGIVTGDEVQFRLMVSKDSHWIESLRNLRVSTATVRAPRPIAEERALSALKPGDLLPDHELRGENGKPLRFSDFRGNAVAFTFIFSRCPLPDFCPRMSNNFEQSRSLLKNDPSGPTNWHFLSISFDPDFDNPAVLTRYARSYRGDDTNRWTFAAVPTKTLPELSMEIDLAVSRQGGGFSHNLRTIILDPLGRIHRQFAGNQWSPKQLADSVKEAAMLQKK